MKTYGIYILTIIMALAFLHGCGPSEEELRQQEIARQDSLQRVWDAQMEQIRLDSLEMVRQMAEAEEAERQRIVHDESGRYEVQVESWRSEAKAQAQVNKWKERGFENAFVVKFGDESKGDLWYRVRLGRYATTEMAETLKTNVMEEYNTPAWVSIVSR